MARLIQYVIGTMLWLIYLISGFVWLTDDAGVRRRVRYERNVLRDPSEGTNDTLATERIFLAIVVAFGLIALMVFLAGLYWRWYFVSFIAFFIWRERIFPVLVPEIERRHWATVVACGHCGVCGTRLDHEGTRQPADAGGLITCQHCNARWNPERITAPNRIAQIGQLLGSGTTHRDGRGVIVVFYAIPGSVCYTRAFESDEQQVRSNMLEDHLRLKLSTLPGFEIPFVTEPDDHRRYCAAVESALGLGCCPCCAATIGDRDAGFDGNVSCLRCGTSWPRAQLAQPVPIQGEYAERLRALRERERAQREGLAAAPVYQACRGCGYDTMGTRGFCPECGLLPVGEPLDPGRVQPRAEAAAIDTFAFKTPLCAACRRELPGVDRSCEACGYVTGTVYA